ncbi:38k protein [Catopsilia pomona nucleopolyhedrovirus]|uniref:38k protein n=1 Tax=Catopsilia pomona nucleopolyhedrovirus TaxID=1850906 RepID=A0A172WZC4_9ABAC|nr:38k protein [Catopsilia pomona nucleopolyhedrovirus]ANF29696.1 38k protein [Catopsilia pomona nucleopolyhedrovirus]
MSQFATPTAKWICLRLNDALIKRHVLVVAEYADLKYLGFERYKYFEFVIFQFCNDPQLCRIIETNHNYCMQIFKCADDMRNIRCNVKRAFKTSVLGHICVLNNKPPMYSFLKEWYLLPDFRVDRLSSESLIWGFPHIVVFDLDSTLITEEEHVQIRDPYVYDSLQELRDIGCVLVLWSYGSRDHVVYSMRNLELESYFDIIISEGSNAKHIDSNSRSSSSNNDNVIAKTNNVVVIDYKLKKRFVEATFNFDMNDDELSSRRIDDDTIPKSPKIVIKYLSDKNVNYFKSITLVDDLPTNNYAYDYYVRVDRCPVPLHDWKRYHDEIVDNIAQYDDNFNY